MPQATDLVVKNASDVDKTFTLLAPAAGFGGLASWALKEGPTSNVYPTFSAQAIQQASANMRLHFRFKMPAYYTSVTTGLPVVNNAVEWHLTGVVPSAYPQASVPDSVAFASNLILTDLVQEMMAGAGSAN
jgi:hypothetical protein